MAHQDGKDDRLERIRAGLRLVAERARTDSEFVHRLKKEPAVVLAEYDVDFEQLTEEMAANEDAASASPRRECKVTCFDPWPTIRCTSISVLV